MSKTEENIMKNTLHDLLDNNDQLQVANSNEHGNHDFKLENPKLTYHALVLDAILRQSLVAVRSLGRRGLRVAAAEASNKLGGVSTPPTFSSRWCQQKFIAPSYEQSTEPFLTYLEQMLDQTGARVLITSSDGTLALIRQHRKQLERRVAVALAKDPALGIAINKDQTLEIATQLGIAVPRGVKVGSVNEVSAALHEIGLPAVIKPIESWLWGEQQGARLACKLVTTPEEARRAVEELTRLGGSTLFQQFLSGRREAVSCMYANGEMYARFAQWAKRTQPPLGGTSVLRQGIAIPADIGDQAEHLVREIELEGYSEIEFRRDSNGTSYLMEINPRLSASVEVAVRAGLDFSYLLYKWANGGPIERVAGYRIGGWMRPLGGDITTTLAALRQRGRPGITPPVRTVWDVGISFLSPMAYDYLQWTDLRPAVKATTTFARDAIRRLTARARKN